VNFQLRKYQTDCIEQIRAVMHGGTHSVLFQLPTGGGKTALASHMLATAAKKGLSCWFTVHRRELIKQSIRAFHNIGIEAGIISSGFPESKGFKIQIASIQTLIKRVGRFPAPKLIVWDECHHIAAKSWASLHEKFSGAYHIGLTATPERLDGRGLGQFFKAMVNGPSVEQLIHDGFLSPYRLYAPATVNLEGVHTQMGDYMKSELAAVVDKPKITGDAVAHYMKYAYGRRAVAFCVSIQHSRHLVEQFNSAGVPAEHVDGDTPAEQRDHAIKMFSIGEIKVLSNVDLFGEGFDVPAIECAILLRPTKSLGVYLQQCGRALRPMEGKTEAIILDHVGNCQRHGLLDEPREWSLEGRAKKKRGEDEGRKVRICPTCFAAMFLGAARCSFCGFSFAAPAGAGREIDKEDGELQEVNAEQLRRMRNQEQGMAKTLEDLIAVGRARNYKFPERWAHNVFQARQAKKLAEGRFA